MMKPAYKFSLCWQDIGALDRIVNFASHNLSIVISAVLLLALCMACIFLRVTPRRMRNAFGVMYRNFKNLRTKD
jgi:hypothetical protein